MTRVTATIEGTQKIKELVEKRFSSTTKFLESIKEKCSKQQYYNFLDQTRIEEEAADAIFQELDLLKKQYILSSHPLEYPDGCVSLSSYYYVERFPIESEAYKQIVRERSLIRIKAPNLMGKSSLVDRIIDYALLQDYKPVSLNLNTVPETTLIDIDKFLRWFSLSVTKAITKDNKLRDYWDVELFGSVQSCTDYFEEYLLTNIDCPLVLCLDNLDRLFQYPTVTKDFLEMLRDWYEKGNNISIWKKLRLVIAHSTTDYINQGINYSPFNVGFPLQLPKFNEIQVLDLAQRHQLDWKKEAEIEVLMAMVGGHPYLVRKAMFESSYHNIELKKMLKDADEGTGIYNDHLRRILTQLQKTPEVLEALKTVAKSSSPVNLEDFNKFKLRSMGLINQTGELVQPSCELYRKYFSK